MQLTPLKMSVAAVFLVAAVAIGLMMPVTTVTSWVIVVALGILPSVFMLRAWRQPAQTTSQRIQAEIRK